ncbi:MAG: Hsp20/alpha crystallin family protein [Clostridiales bacterium]|nr:Hsp20/alpha crystallin family protein [Clostridiales bacterium]MCF8021819.1 Hsp20/alpha crystallin family protein [Clostridiales bacterium]
MRRGKIPFVGSNMSLKRPIEEIFRVMDDSFERLKKIFVDVYEENNTIVVEADLPGFKKEDVRVDVRDDSLFLHASRDNNEEEKNRNYYRRDRVDAQLKEEISLPLEVDKENAAATMKDGVLEIRLPKVESYEDVNRIDIK